MGALDQAAQKLMGQHAGDLHVPARAGNLDLGQQSAQQEVLFSSASGLSPQQGLCLVFRWIANGTACKVYGQDRNVTTPNSYVTKSTDRQATWSKLTAQSLLYQVYGTVTTSGTPQIQEAQYLRAVDITLRTGSDESATAYAAARPLNRPKMP